MPERFEPICCNLGPLVDDLLQKAGVQEAAERQHLASLFTQELERRAENITLPNGTTYNRAYVPHETEARRERILKDFHEAASELRSRNLGGLRDDVVKVIETSELALGRATECELGNMTDALKFVGRARTWFRLHAVSEPTTKAVESFTEISNAVDEFTDGAVTRLIKEALGNCGCSLR